MLKIKHPIYISIALLCMANVHAQPIGQPLAQAQSNINQRSTLGATAATQVTANAAVKQLATPPDLSIDRVALIVPNQNTGLTLVSPDGRAYENQLLQWVESSNTTPAIASAAPASTQTPKDVVVSSCNETVQMALIAWVSNNGGSTVDANTAQLGLSGTLAGQPVQFPLGQMTGNLKQKYFQVGHFPMRPGKYELNLAVNSAKGGGETNFANNQVTRSFELRCTAKSTAQGMLNKSAVADLTVVKDAAKPATAGMVPLGAASASSAALGIAGSAAKVIQFNKSDTNLSLKNEPDSTVLIGANGERKTVGEIKQLIKSSQPFSKPAINDASAKAQARFQEKIARITSNQTGSSKSQSMELADRSFASEVATIGLVKTCKEQNKPPTISKVLGDVTPGAEIIIRGSCFEDQPREVRLSGQNLKSVVRLNIKSWTGYRIVAQVPAISGAIEGSSELQVITIDEKSTVSFPVAFTPAYELVDVSKFFSAGCSDLEDDYNHIQCFSSGMKMDNSAYTGGLRAVSDSYPHDFHGASWDLNINKNCTANNAWTKSAQGTFTKFEWGVSNTSSKEALKVSLKAASWLDKHWYGDTVHYVANYSLGADAYCPVGIAPGS